jgi:hypothetical protein
VTDASECTPQLETVDHEPEKSVDATAPGNETRSLAFDLNLRQQRWSPPWAGLADLPAKTRWALLGIPVHLEASAIRHFHLLNRPFATMRSGRHSWRLVSISGGFVHEGHKHFHLLCFVAKPKYQKQKH